MRYGNALGGGMPMSGSSFGGGAASVGGSFGSGGYALNRLGMGMPMQMPDAQPFDRMPQRAVQPMAPAPEVPDQRMPIGQGQAPTPASPYALMAQRQKAAMQLQPDGPPALMDPQGGRAQSYQMPAPAIPSLMRSFG